MTTTRSRGRTSLDLAHRITGGDRPPVQGVAHGARGHGHASRRSRPPTSKSRVAGLIEQLDATGANLAVRDAKRAVDGGRWRALLKRGIIHKDRHQAARPRALRPPVLRADHPAPVPVVQRPPRLPPTGPNHARCPLEVVLPRAGPQHDPRSRLASKYGMAKPTSFARRFIAGETADEAIVAARDHPEAGMLLTLDQLGESITTLGEADAATKVYLDAHREDRGGRHRPQHLRQADPAGARHRPGRLRPERPAYPRPREAAGLLRPRRHGEHAVHPEDARHVQRGLGRGVPQHRRRAAVGRLPLRRRCARGVEGWARASGWSRARTRSRRRWRTRPRPTWTRPTSAS